MLSASHARLIARSLFPITLLMALSGLIALPLGLYRHPPLIAILILSMVALVWFYRQSETGLNARLSRLKASWLAGLSAGLFIFLLIGFLWALSLPLGAALLLIFWLLMWLALLAALYWSGIKRLAHLLQPLLSGLGLVILLLLILEGALRLYSHFAPDPAPDIALVEFQPEIWNTITDTPVEWAEQYWIEYQLARQEIMWTPYVYWRMRPFDGDYVNVNALGLRATPPPSESPQMTVHVYGGSTVWGHGARDAHTIPAELVYALEERGLSAEVVNMGEVGYISRQDATLFDTQLSLGNVPDVAIFYWGFNDANITYSDGYIGVSGAEKNRGAQFEGAQCVLDLSAPTLINGLLYKTELGGRLLRRLDILPINPAEGCALGIEDWSNVNADLVALQSTDPAAFAANLQHMTRYIRGLAEAYGVEVWFVWQPSIHLKAPLSWYEAQIVEQARLQDWWDYYDALDSEMRMLFDDDPRFLLWADFVWQTDPTTNIFIDRVHITEEGNALIAQALAEQIQP